MAGALILNQYGVPGAWSQPEEDGRRKRGQGRSTDPQPIWGFQVEKDGGGDKAGALILNQYGGPGAWLNLKKTEAGTRPERLPSTNMGVPGAYGRSAYPQPIRGSQVRGLNLKRRRRGQGRSAYPQPIRGSQVRGLNLKKTETGTRPEGLSSTNTEAQGRERS